VVAERHQGREELMDDCGIDTVEFLPYGIGDSIRARCRGGGGFGEGEFNFLSGEWDGGGVF